MARIRIVDEWLRSPVSPPTYYRSIMVVAETWSEQRVLMRAFSDSDDQTRPTVVLHGAELAIGPAGTDPHGPWGIHVEPPVDGRAQELRGQLEEAARRLAGSRGNPPRLSDEASAFDRKRTNHWAPGAPPDLPTGRRTSPGHSGGYWEPAEVARPVDRTDIPSAAPRPAPASMPTVAPHVGHRAPAHGPPPPQPGGGHGSPPVDRTSSSSTRTRRRRRGWTSPLPSRPAPEVGNRTAGGFAAGPVRSSSGPPPETASQSARRLGSLVTRTMPMGFRLSEPERTVLNRLGEVSHLTARKVGEIAGVADGVAWMEQLMARLADHGLDLVAPGDDVDGEPTYVLRR